MDTSAKIKVLINCRKASVLKDFYVYSDTLFELMSTSGFWADISLHLSVYEPDAYVVTSDEFDNDIVNQICNMKKGTDYAHIPVIVVTSGEAYDEYVMHGTNLFDAVIKRGPFNIIKEKIVSVVNNDRKKRPAKAETPAPEKEDKLEMELRAIEEELFKSKKHILVVDDDRNILKLLKNALESKYDVTSMLNGKMAEKYLETKTADLILLDYEMPVETGPEVFQKIRKSERLADIPIVFLTGVADREKIQQVLTLKPQGYLLKPIDIERLYETINNLIG